MSHLYLFGGGSLDSGSLQERRCDVNPDLVDNDLLHLEQINLAPVCFFFCLFKWPLVA